MGSVLQRWGGSGGGALRRRLLQALPRPQAAHARRAHLNPAGLKEPSSIAHSAMLLLALAAWDRHPSGERRRSLMAQLAAGILRQQRDDGSLKARLLAGLGP